MHVNAQLVFLCGCVFFWTCAGQYTNNEFQFETLKTEDGPKPWVWRSEAMEKKTLRLDRRGRKTVRLTLCAEPAIPGRPVTAYIDNVRYSNDGPSDTVVVTINNIPIASFETTPFWAWGNHWNVFYDTGRIGRSFTLVKGVYKMALRATTDEYGVELDKIDVKTLNQKPGVNIICRASFGGQDSAAQ